MLQLDQCAVGKVASSKDKFVPSINRNVSIQTHSAHFTHKGAVDMFCAIILG